MTTPMTTIDQLNELEKKLTNATFPDKIMLNSAVEISNPKQMVKSHLSYLKNNLGNTFFLPYYERLLEMEKLITQN